VSDDRIEKEAGGCIYCIVESRNGFIPFGEIINSHNNVLVTITLWGVACHKFHAPFVEWIDCNDYM
jgi:hypothetical protein